MTNIGLINDSVNILRIEKMLSCSGKSKDTEATHAFLVQLVHTTSPLSAPQIFTYGTKSEPLSPSHDSSAESVTPKVNPTPHNNPPNQVPNVPDEPYSYPSSSYSSLSDSSDSSDDYSYKRGQRRKNNKNKFRSETRFHDPIKNCANITTNLLNAPYKSKTTRFNLDEDPLKCQVHLLSFMRSLIFLHLSLFYHHLRKNTCCLWTLHP